MSADPSCGVSDLDLCHQDVADAAGAGGVGLLRHGALRVVPGEPAEHRLVLRRQRRLVDPERDRSGQSYSTKVRFDPKCFARNSCEKYAINKPVVYPKCNMKL